MATLAFFFFNDTATTEIYTLSLHDALPISPSSCSVCGRRRSTWARAASISPPPCRRSWARPRSEEHTSELQSRLHLVCRLLLEKKKSLLSYALEDDYERQDFRCATSAPYVI